MEPAMKDKRVVSSYVPYRKRGDSYEFFLQMRDTNARINAGLFGLFGGGCDEGETPLQGLMREVQEELEYTPQKPIYFSRYELAPTIFHVFVEEVSSDFESRVHVNEGEYGTFLLRDEILYSKSVSLFVKVFVFQFSDYLETQAA